MTAAEELLSILFSILLDVVLVKLVFDALDVEDGT